jgi:hypothetical protein
MAVAVAGMEVSVGRGVFVGFVVAVAVGNGLGVLVAVDIGSGTAVGADENPAHARLMVVIMAINNKMGERLIFMSFSFGYIYWSIGDKEI